MIFKQFFPSQILNKIKEHPKYDSVINNPLNLIDSIDRSIHEPMQATYPYLPLTEYLSRMVNTRQQEKRDVWSTWRGLSKKRSS